MNSPPDLATQDVFPHGACAEAQYLSRFAQCEQVISDRWCRVPPFRRLGNISHCGIVTWRASTSGRHAAIRISNGISGLHGAKRAPGTTRTYIPKQIPLSTQRVTVPFWRECVFRTVLRKFRLRPGKFPGESPLNVPQSA